MLTKEHVPWVPRLPDTVTHVSALLCSTLSFSSPIYSIIAILSLMTKIGNACSLNSLLVYTTECDSLHSS